MSIKRPEGSHKKDKGKIRKKQKSAKKDLQVEFEKSKKRELDTSHQNQSRKRCIGEKLRKIKNLRWKQIILLIVISEGVIFGAAWLCYDNLRWMIPLQILMYPIYRILDAREKKQRKSQYLNGFREVLQSLVTSLQAGYSLENSSRLSLEEMEGLYPSGKNPTVMQMQKIVRGIELHCPVEQLYMQYAQETQVEEIYEFAVVLNIVRNTGGNVVEILKNTMEHLQSKMDATEELEVSLSGRIYEKNIMLLMPFGILLYLRVANPGYIDALYSNLAGNLMMTAVIGIDLICFFWTEKIMEIDF